MDETESWLAANDPLYETTRKGWLQVTSGPAYRTPYMEIAAGDGAQILGRITPTQLPVGHGATAQSALIRCRICSTVFRPREAKNDLCRSELCKKAARREARRDYLRAYMRAYRQRAA